MICITFLYFHLLIYNCLKSSFLFLWASLVAQTVRNTCAMWETWVWSMGWEDPLEEGTATHSSILAWRIPWTEEPGRLQSMGSQQVGLDWVTKLPSLTYSLTEQFMISTGGVRGATPRSRSGGREHEEILVIQGKEQRLRFAGAAVKRYPSSKVGETQVRR